VTQSRVRWGDKQDDASRLGGVLKKKRWAMGTRKKRKKIGVDIGKVVRPQGKKR